MIGYFEISVEPMYLNVKEKPQFTKVKLRSENFYFHNESGFIFVQKGILSSGLMF